MSLERIRELARRTVFFLYAMIFRRDPGPVARKFMKNLGFIFTGLVIAKVLSLVFQIYVARTIGVLEYGKFAIVSSISAFFWVPMFMGLGTAIVKYLAEQRSEEEKRAVVSTGVTLTLVFIAAFSAVFYILSPWLASLFSVSPAYILLAIVLALCYSAWILTQRICQGLDRIKKLGSLNAILYAVALLSALVLSVYTMDTVVPVAALCAGYIATTIFIFPELRRYFRPGISSKWAGTIMSYGFIIVLGSIPFAINENINKVFLGVFLTFTEVGLYQAYYFSTLTLATFFVTGFVMVFFPEAARQANKANIFSQLGRLFRFAPLFYAIFLAFSFAILSLYGSAYAVAIPLLLLFVLAAVIVSMHSLYIWLSTSISIRGVKITTYSLAIIAALNVILAYNLIPPFKLYGAAVSIVISYIIGLIFTYRRLGRLVGEKDE